MAFIHISISGGITLDLKTVKETFLQLMSHVVLKDQERCQLDYTLKFHWCGIGHSRIKDQGRVNYSI